MVPVALCRHERGVSRARRAFWTIGGQIGRIRVFLGGYGLLLVAYLCAAVPSGGAAATVLCLVMLGSFYAATDGVLSAAAAALVPAGLRGSAIGTVQTVVAATRLFSSLAFGWLWFDLGRDTAMYAVAVALALVLPLAWWMVRGVHTLTGTRPVSTRMRVAAFIAICLLVVGGTAVYLVSREVRRRRNPPRHRHHCRPRTLTSSPRRTQDCLPQHRRRARLRKGCGRRTRRPGWSAGTDWKSPAIGSMRLPYATVCLSSQGGVTSTYTETATES